MKIKATMNVSICESVEICNQPESNPALRNSFYLVALLGA